MKTNELTQLADELQRIGQSIHQQQPALTFPTHGWQSSRFWAVLFGETDKNFRAKVKEKQIPFAMFGRNFCVRAEHLAAYLDSQVNKNSEEEDS